jgi:cobalt-zinc-cadmium efflux system protein
VAHAHHTADIPAHRLALAVGLTVAFVALEAISGWWASSLALMSDAGHNLADAAALGLSWYALVVSQRPAGGRMTYGYHRVGILAALVNSVTLVVIALVIAWEAVHRIQSPVNVQPLSMIVVALVAVALNTTIGVWLHSGKADLNIRSAYLHMAGDAVAAAGVVVAGLIAWQTGSSLADPVVSLLIAALIGWSSWDVLKRSVNLLMEGAPHHIDLDLLQEAIRSVTGVTDVHDLHVWGLSAGVTALSCHINVSAGERSDADLVLRTVTRRLRDDYGVRHSTIQVEMESADGDGCYGGDCSKPVVSSHRDATKSRNHERAS